MSAVTPRSNKDYRRTCNTTPKVLRDAMTTVHSTSDVGRELPLRTCATTARPDRITWLMALDAGGTNQGAFTMRPEPNYLAVVAPQWCCGHFYLGYRRGNAAP